MRNLRLQKSKEIAYEITELIEKNSKCRNLIVRPTYFNSYRKIFDGYEIIRRSNNPDDSEQKLVVCNFDLNKRDSCVDIYAMRRDPAILRAINEAAKNFPIEFLGEIKRNLKDFFDEEFKRSIIAPRGLWKNSKKFNSALSNQPYT